MNITVQLSAPCTDPERRSAQRYSQQTYRPEFHAYSRSYCVQQNDQVTKSKQILSVVLLYINYQ